MSDDVVKFFRRLVLSRKDEKRKAVSEGGGSGDGIDRVYDAKSILANKNPTKITAASSSKQAIKKSKSTPALITSTKGPSTPNFELTPMSKIIAQSYKDISILRALQAKNQATAEGVGVGKFIDFDKIEENLKKFEQMYNQFLRYGSKYGTEVDEVYLVAMWCKDSTIDRKNLGVGELGGKGKEREADCLPAVPDCGL